MTRMGNLHAGGQSSPGHLSLVHRDSDQLRLSCRMLSDLSRIIGAMCYQLCRTAVTGLYHFQTHSIALLFAFYWDKTMLAELLLNIRALIKYKEIRQPPTNVFRNYDIAQDCGTKCAWYCRGLWHQVRLILPRIVAPSAPDIAQDCGTKCAWYCRGLWHQVRLILPRIVAPSAPDIAQGPLTRRWLKSKLG